MKCPHCGVYFEEEEKRCPFCDCPVNGHSFHNKNCKIDDSAERKFFREKPVKETRYSKKFTTKMPNLKKIQTTEQKGKKVGFLVFALLGFFFLLAGCIGSIVEYIDSHDGYQIYTPEKEAEYWDYQIYGVYKSQDGSSLLTLKGDQFILQEQATGMEYSGYFSLTNLESQFYNSDYPENAYDGYELYLSFDSGYSPMADGAEYVFYEVYEPDPVDDWDDQYEYDDVDEPDSMIILNYNGTGSNQTFIQIND